MTIVGATVPLARCADCNVVLPLSRDYSVYRAWEDTTIHYCATHFRAWAVRSYGEDAVQVMETMKIAPVIQGAPEDDA